MNRFRLFNPLFAMLALVFATCTPAVISAGEKITVMNPAITTKIAQRLPMTAPRLDTLEGKTIYLIDNQWGGPEGAYQLLEEMQNWFAENSPGIKTVLRRTKGNMFTDDPELWQEISERGDAAIVGVGQ
ncbi:MAG: hypothetical protein EPO31_01830 [Gammaproteobacteria bacterium]|nr:MAG: hypothetical protein EPO31_01830 [Gammaproteobacteria bacterium]